MALVRCMKCKRNTSDLGRACIFCGQQTDNRITGQGDTLSGDAPIDELQREPRSDYGRHIESYVWDG